MKIEFDKMEATVYQNFRHGEGEWHMKLFDDGMNKYLMGTLKPGASIGAHTHRGDSEMFYIISGTGKVLCDGETEELKPGDLHYCPMGHKHSLINTGSEDLVVLAAVPKHPVVEEA